MLTETFFVLVRLHLRIAGRFVRQYHKEVAVLIIVLAWFDTLSANGVEQNFSSVLFMFATLGIGSLQFQRKDKGFLKDLLPNVGFFLCIENLALSLPVVLVLLLLSAWKLALLLLVIASVLSQINFKLSWTRKRTLRLPLPAHAFEWRAGFRKRGLLILGSYLLILVPGGNAAFSVLGVLFVASTVANFYIASEGYALLDVLADPPQTFLLRKVCTAWLLFGVCALPLLIAVALRLDSHYWVVPATFGISLLAISSSVLMKYAYFQPGDDSKMRSTMNGLILVTSLMILPLNFYYEWYLWRKAHDQLPIYSQTDNA